MSALLLKNFVQEKVIIQAKAKLVKPYLYPEVTATNEVIATFHPRKSL